jgi:hypothetical protein
MKKLIKIKNKVESKNYLIIIILICIIITFGVYKTVSNHSELNQKSEYTVGTITKKYYVFNRGHYVHYNYIVNSILFSSSCKLLIDEDSVMIGGKFEVKYSPKNPKNSKLMFNKRIKNE